MSVKKVKNKVKIVLKNKKKPQVTKNAKSKLLPKKIKTKIKVKAKVKIKTKVKVKSKPKAKVQVSRSKTKTVKKAVVVARPPVLGPSVVKPYQLKEKEEYMNKKQLEHLRRILLSWKSELMREVDRTMHHMQDESANYPDPIDRASQEEEFNLELRTRDRERKLLKKIEETLERMGENDYGYCDVCGAEIGVRRLEARPTASMCIECKTIAEIREKQTGEGG